MRYAIVTETYPPEVNGVALTVHALESGLRSRGHEVSLVRPLQEHERGTGKETHTPRDHSPLLLRGAALPKYPGLRFGFPATRRLVDHWNKTAPDAIYVATEGPLGWSALRAACTLGIPVATGLHTRFDQYMCDYGLSLLQNTAMAWMRRFHNSAQATLVPTRELARFLETKDFRQVVRLPRAVDSQHFNPVHRDGTLRSQWGIAERGLAVIHVGRIAAEKNLELAVRAYRALQRTRPDARFVWVGDGPARERLRRDNPDFIFCGIQRDAALAAHWASGDLFLFPSHSETFGNVTLEAMASGVATVAFDTGAAHEHLRDGVHGAAVQDDQQFIYAAVRLAGDDALRRDMGSIAHEAMQTLRPEQVAADFDAILANLVRTGSSYAATAPA